MSTVIDSIERAQLRRVPDFRAGDRLRVHFVVIEGSRRRTQVFEGVAIKRQGVGARETFTVRKQSFGVGVERTFPLHSPKIERIEVAARGDVRRAKLYYLRDRVGKAARVRERGYVGPEETIEPGLLHAPVEPEVAAHDGEDPELEAGAVAVEGEADTGAQADVDTTEDAATTDAADAPAADAPAEDAPGEDAPAEADAEVAQETEAGTEEAPGGAEEEQAEVDGEASGAEPEAGAADAEAGVGSDEPEASEDAVAGEPDADSPVDPT